MISEYDFAHHYCRPEHIPLWAQQGMSEFVHQFDRLTKLDLDICHIDKPVPWLLFFEIFLDIVTTKASLAQLALRLQNGESLKEGDLEQLSFPGRLDSVAPLRTVILDFVVPALGKTHLEQQFAYIISRALQKSTQRIKTFHMQWIVPISQRSLEDTGHLLNAEIPTKPWSFPSLETISTGVSNPGSFWTLFAPQVCRSVTQLHIHVPLEYGPPQTYRTEQVCGKLIIQK